MKINLSIDCTNITLQGFKGGVTADLENVECSELLENIPVSEAVKYYDVGDLLDQIGKDAARNYFGLID